MDLDGAPYRAFLAVARHESFTRAAEALNISQPALSATIRELERRLGFSLFDRTSRRVALTREGQSFLVNARRVVLEHDWASQRARELRSSDLRLAVQPYSSLIGDRVALTDGYMDAHPWINVQITQVSSARIYDAIQQDDADIGIVLEPVHRLEMSPLNQLHGGELETRQISTRLTGLILPAGHPLSGLEAIPEAALRALPVAVTGRVHGAPLASAMTRWLQEMGAEPVRVPEADVYSTLRHARRKGIAAVDTGWFAPLPDQADMLRRPVLTDHPLQTELVLLRNSRLQRPATDHFWHNAVL